MNRFKKFLILILGIFAVIYLAFYIYASDYYKADDYAKSAIENLSGEITVIESKNMVIFKSKDETKQDTGFIFYPGGKVEAMAYAPLLDAISEGGITTVLVTMPYNLAILDTDRANEVLETLPEIKSWYIGGHSLGGAAAAMYLAKNTEIFDGLILLGAYSSKDISNSKLRVLSIYGSEDRVLNREKYEEARSNLPKETYEFIINGGCHAYFGCYGSQKGDGEPSITFMEQQSITADKIINFIYLQ